MKKYISREWLENKLTHYMSKSRGAEHYAYERIKEELNFVDVTDIWHVKNGRWIFSHRDWNELGELIEFVNCSECGYLHDWEDNFCPDCGAKMG